MAKIPGPGKKAPASAAFCLDLNEVTVADHAACVARGRCAQPVAYAANDRLDQYRAFCNWHRPAPRENHPINCVSFDQARTFCAKRGARLPTDVEWTWAATNGSTTTFPWGTETPGAARVNGCGAECPPAVIAATGRDEMKAAYAGNDGFGDTAPVGSFARGDNRWGVHDLAGNVAEFVVPVAAPESAGDLAAGGAFLTQAAHFMKGATPTRTAWAADAR
jgi:formylglycine-generating enzyme required for sulfatase activity